MQANPGQIQTGYPQLDGTLTVLLGTTILVGGVLGCFLDNVVPGNVQLTMSVESDTLIAIFKSGTRSERGLDAWEKEMSLKSNPVADSEDAVRSTYDFPYGMSVLRR